MKKVLALLAIVAFVACNNSETTEPAADTTTVAPAPAPAAPAVDTTAKPADTTKPATEAPATK